MLLVIYRPPGSDLSLFNEEIENTIRVLCRPKTNLFLMGDCNINLLNHKTHADTGDFLTILYANTMLPMITRTPRYDEFSATLIDNIITNKFSGTSLAGILLDDISDHLPVFLIAGENDVAKQSLSLKRKSANNSQQPGYCY